MTPCMQCLLIHVHWGWSEDLHLIDTNLSIFSHCLRVLVVAFRAWVRAETVSDMLTNRSRLYCTVTLPYVDLFKNC